MEDCSDVERGVSGMVRFFLLDTGIVPSLLGFESKGRSIPKEQFMPVLSVLERFFYYLSFTQLSGWHPLPEYHSTQHPSISQMRHAKPILSLWRCNEVAAARLYWHSWR
jgi:hypothetical protein